MESSRKAHYLQIAAFVVAIFRYMAMGGMAIGHDVFKAAWLFVAFEIASWGAMAILEGFAMPFISKGMKQFPTNSFYWKQLLVYRIILLVAIPLLGAPLYAAVSRGSTIEQVLHPWLYWGWLILFSGLVALIVDGVGIVDEVEVKEGGSRNTSLLKTEAWGILSQAYAVGGTLIFPSSLVDMMSGRITKEEARDIVAEWYETLPKKPGVKSEAQKELEGQLNGKVS